MKKKLISLIIILSSVFIANVVNAKIAVSEVNDLIRSGNLYKLHRMYYSYGNYKSELGTNSCNVLKATFVENLSGTLVLSAYTVDDLKHKLVTPTLAAIIIPECLKSNLFEDDILKKRRKIGEFNQLSSQYLLLFKSLDNLDYTDYITLQRLNYLSKDIAKTFLDIFYE